LLNNAWKFTAKTPHAHIEVGCEDGAFFVRDNGAGFDSSRADELFNPFRRLHAASEYPGTGVGLSIVQRIVRRHGGWISAQAAPGQGATFSFTLARNGDQP
jgi:signal transduction histidine kinase